MKRVLYLLAMLVVIFVFVITYFIDYSMFKGKSSIGGVEQPRINQVTPEPNRLLPPARAK